MKFDIWEVAGYDRPAAVSLCRSGINPLVSVILSSRGIKDKQHAEEFLKSGMEIVHDPFLLPDMDKAVQCINAAIENRRHVAVYGDYDVDGMTSSCLMADYLRSRGLECEIYIPGRVDEGYGMNNGAIDTLKEKGVSLIVTVDCGITDIDSVIYAQSIGIDVIVTDHHECKDVLPPAKAVVNPKRPDSRYPNRTLAGVGVAFKLVCALAGEDKREQIFEEYSDLVAIGTIADVVSVVGENRVLIKRGLEKINSKRCRAGIQSLIMEAGIDYREIKSADIGFSLAPRLNAAGRMGRTSLTVDLLLTKQHPQVDIYAAELCKLNHQRRELVSQITQQALDMINDRPDGNPVILAGHGWHQGVMGIVSSRLVDRYFLPCIMISIDENGVGRGSCRSMGYFNLYEALCSCSDLLINFGGHEMAAGITIKEENIEQFKRRFNEYYHSKVSIPSVPRLMLDFEVVKPGLLSLENVTALDELEPFGNGNAQPRLCIKGAFLNYMNPVGGGQHTRMRVTRFSESFDCIFFSAPMDSLEVSPGDTVDLAFELYINNFRGRRSVQFVITDIRKHLE
jgi:single-stranded-DNA-specific exonuclease